MGLVLLGCFLNATVLKDIHHLLAHDHQHGEACCETAKGTVHFHELDLEADDCLLCHLNLSSFGNKKKTVSASAEHIDFTPSTITAVHFVKSLFYKASAPRAPPSLV